MKLIGSFSPVCFVFLSTLPSMLCCILQGTLSFSRNQQAVWAEKESRVSTCHLVHSNYVVDIEEVDQHGDKI